MWLKVVVVGLKAAAGQKPKAAEVFCRFNVNESPCQVQDQSLAAFCWPLGPENQNPKEFMAPEEFTFTLTQGDGSRLQGFCRRFLPPAPRVGSRLRYPQVLCLVCEAAWSALFFKVLEVTEQLLRQTDILSDFSHQQLPAGSLAGTFFSNLGSVLAQQPALGSVIRVELPRISIPLAMSPPKRIGAASSEDPGHLLLTEEVIELQVPPDSGNGTANAGVSLARLLWHVPVPAMVTLIASLLLERRVLVVGQSRDMVSAAVCAAQALIHPFRWHHIFLPLLPRSLADYLTAPMPFLIGLPAQLLPAIKNLPMDEITLIDLDLGKCEPAPGSARDDAMLLPWRDQLESALHAAFSMLKSPTEHESNAVIAGIMHGYLLKLLGNYRSHIYPEGTGPGFTAQPPSSPAPNGLSPMSVSSRPGHQRSRSASPLQNGGGSSSLAAFAAAVTGGGGLGEQRHSPRGTTSNGGVASVGSSRRQSRTSSSNVGRADEGMKAHGFWFDHSGLVATHRRNEKARNFLTLLRQSQLFEVFVRERLAMCANVEGGPEFSGDPFEQLVNVYLDNRSRRLSARLGAGVRTSLSRFGALIKRHRRTDSTQSLSAFGLSGASSSGAAELSGTLSGNGGLMSALKNKGGGGLTASFSERPEAVRMRQMVASFAAAAEQMRRNLTDSGSKSGTRQPASSLEAFAEKVVSVFDPSAFFDDDDEDDLEVEAAAAEAASSSGRLSRSSMSSSSLKDLVAGPLIAPSGASWTAGASSVSRVGPLVTQSVHSGFAGLSSSSSGIVQHQGGLGGSSLSRSSAPLGRHSVPAIMSVPGGDRPPSPAPMIDLGDASHGLTAAQRTPSSSASAAYGHQQQQQQQPPRHRYLEQLQMPAQQQQQHPQQHSPSSPRDIQAQWQQQQHHQQQQSPSGNRDSLIQQYMRPPLSGYGGSLRGQQQQQQQHINVKAALAAIAPGPLPQPPQPRARSLVGGHILEPQAGQHTASMQPLRQGLANLSHQQHQPQQQGLPGGAGPAAVGAPPQHASLASEGSLSNNSSGNAAAAAAPAWDPFAELLTERMASLSGTASGQPTVQQQQQPQPQLGPLSLHSRGMSSGSEASTSAHCRITASSSSGSSRNSSSEGGAGSTSFSTNTTPAAQAASSSSCFLLEDPEGSSQQPPLQQQPTMPEAWLSVISEEAGGHSDGSAISLNGSNRSRTAASAAAGGGVGLMTLEDPGLSQLKQAFAQQLLVQHSSAGDDLL